MKKLLRVSFIGIISLFSLSFTYSATTNITRNLSLGSSGNDVKVLQQILAKDSSVYPKGLVSGYYGQLTKNAVEAFQKKYNLTPTSQIDTKTLNFVNNFIAGKPIDVTPTFAKNTPVASTTTNQVITSPVSNIISSTSSVSSPSFSNSTSTKSRRVIIKYKVKPTKTDEDNIVSKFNGKKKRTYHIAPLVSAEVPESEISKLSTDPNVESVSTDEPVKASSLQEYANSWGVTHIKADIVHTAGITGKTVKVAILDSGIDYNHLDLNTNYVGGYNFINNTADPMDDNGHGTHIAGIIAALKNDDGVVGVAPDVRIYALKVLDANGVGYSSDIIAALQWAMDNGIQITNNSYGSNVYPGTDMEFAFWKAENWGGILNIAAAGNSGTCAGDTDTVDYPARFDSVVAVSAIDANDVRPCFSATGPKVELSAPGVGINSTKLGGGDIIFSGTSMAAPHVTGEAALIYATGAIKDKNGNGRTNDEVRSILDNSASNIGATNLYGFGLVQSDKAIAMLGIATTTSPVATTTPIVATTTLPVATTTQPIATTTPPQATTTPVVTPPTATTTTPIATTTPVITPPTATTTPVVTPTPVATTTPIVNPIPTPVATTTPVVTPVPTPITTVPVPTTTPVINPIPTPAPTPAPVVTPIPTPKPFPTTLPTLPIKVPSFVPPITGVLPYIPDSDTYEGRKKAEDERKKKEDKAKKDKEEKDKKDKEDREKENQKRTSTTTPIRTILPIVNIPRTTTGSDNRR